MPDEVEQQLRRLLEDTTESAKRASIIAAIDEHQGRKEAANSERWILGFAIASFAVAVLAIVIALAK